MGSIHNITRRSIGLVLPLLMALAGSRLKAGEATPPAGGETPADPEAALAAEEPPFNFEAHDRRDPFTFTKVTAPSISISTADNSGGTEQGSKKLMRAAEVEAKRREAEAFYLEAEQFLMSTEAVQSVARCDRGLEVFKDIPNISEYRDLLDIRERLFRLRKASDRMRQRQDAEREFARLNIHVTGIVARDRNSQAIINANIVNKGDLVATVGDSNDVVIIEDILPDQVVFLFRGYHMTLTLSDYLK